MIIRKKQHWFIMIFVWKGSVLPKLLPRLILLLLLSMAVVYYNDTITRWNLRISSAPFALFGIALALFLGFRNSASYERWWEGRKLWGSLVNTTRSLARQAHTLVEQPSYATPFINCLIAMAYTLKHQLRETDPDTDIDRLLPLALAFRVKAARWKPIILLKVMGYWVQSVKQSRHIDSIQQQSFDQLLNQLSDIIGGCERIQGTPLPYSYSVTLHRIVYIYCFLLPLGLAESLGWITPLIVVFIAYTFVALEAIAEELEKPFGTDPNDLALDTMCRTIENSLLELDDRPLMPDPPTEDFYYLT
ncbi:MAG TPA: bestrophin family ion channel [Puia sp.]|jgi:putative membrane protein|nr:bestrophin family ion channel [Puia sp.]